MLYTTIGYFQNDPECPLNFTVEADSIAEAIQKSELEALEGLKPSPRNPFINTFVFEGETNIVSTWAG